MAGKLVICPTPLGNLGDVTLRSLDALRAADVVCAEDTRVTGKLLAALGIEGKRLERLDENVIGERAADIVSRVQSGETITYCTDAGMPGVSDPGLRLVRVAREAGVDVEVLPGPTAVATAYVASGCTDASFYFGGFFPRKAGERAVLLNTLRTLPAALIFYESPKRLVSALDMIAKAYPQREVAVCRELTKLHEEVARGLSGEVYDLFAARENVKGEIVIVVDGPNAGEHAADAANAREKALERAEQLVEAGERPKQIARILADELGVSRNEAYEIALAAREGTTADPEAAEVPCEED